jgi:hypothetical protein
VHVDALEQFAKALAPANRPGVAFLVEDLRERQARANVLLAAELERAVHRGLHGRLLALADAAEPQPAEGAASEAAAEVAAEAGLAGEASEPAAHPEPDADGDGLPAPPPEWESAA